MLSLQKHIS